MSSSCDDPPLVPGRKQLCVCWGGGDQGFRGGGGGGGGGEIEIERERMRGCVCVCVCVCPSLLSSLSLFHPLRAAHSRQLDLERFKGAD